LTRRQVTFRGRVQGVGFRWFIKETAEALGMAGWVRNTNDGSVEAEVQGSHEAVDTFLIRSQTGNPYARIDEIVSLPVPVKNETTFRID
jgi:acylphosphatase